MRRSRTRGQAVAMSLFPFLAVLICTMGSLVVLLVLVVQQARVEAQAVTQVKQAAHAQQAEKANALEEEKRWQEQSFELLQQSRAQTAEQLTEQQLKLGHLEDHIRRLKEQLEQVLRDAETMEQVGQSRQDQQETARKELDRLRRDIAAAEQNLAQTREATRRQRRSYSIIPYDGPNGTPRRPIYIECLPDRVVLQPEGIELGPDDFRPPLGSSSPLSVALRATREYLVDRGLLGKNGDPYPLLVVRPGGAETYAAARAAMSSWNAEFGYELIDAELQLKYPLPDPALADLLVRTIEDARQRRIRLALAAPSAFGRGRGGGGSGGGFGDGTYLRADPNEGGFVVAGGSGPDRRGSSTFGGDRSGFGSGSSNEPGAGQRGPYAGGGPGGNGNSSSTGMGAGGSPGLGANGGAPGNYPGNGGSIAGPFYPGGQPGTGAGPGGPSGAGAAPTNQYASPGQGMPPGGSMPNGSMPGGTGGMAGSPQAGRTSSQGGVQEGAGSPGGGAGGTNASGSASSGNASSGGAAGSSGGSAGGGSGDPNGSPGSGGMYASLSQSRGENWGVPHAAERSTGFTRPIRVALWPDRLILLPEKGTQDRASEVPINGSVRGAVDQFVAAIWKRMEGWGIAGPRAYWKPVLHVEVAPGAEQQFAELSALLAGSGIDVERKAP